MGTTHDPQLLKGVLSPLLLWLLAERESYGYELVQRLRAAGLSGISEGTVYPALSRLEREGRITSRPAAARAAGRRRPPGGPGTVERVVTNRARTARSRPGRAPSTAGVLAADPHPQGTYHWAGIPYLSADATVTFTGATHTSVGGAFTPLVYLGMLAAFTAGARLWRLLPRGRRHHAITSTAEPTERPR